MTHSIAPYNSTIPIGPTADKCPKCREWTAWPAPGGIGELICRNPACRYQGPAELIANGHDEEEAPPAGVAATLMPKLKSGNDPATNAHNAKLIEKAALELRRQGGDLGIFRYSLEARKIDKSVLDVAFTRAGKRWEKEQRPPDPEPAPAPPPQSSNGLYQSARRGLAEKPQPDQASAPETHPASPPGVRLTFYSDLVRPAPKVWGIKGVFALGENSSWVGPPGGGKSALLTDIAVHKAAGLDWRGYKTKFGGGVAYFALERADLVKRRLTAYRIRDGHENLPIAIAGQIIDLMNKACVAEIMDVLKRTEDRFGIAVVLAVFDTYSKGIAAGGGNEGEAKDQNIVVANLRRVIDQTGIHIASVGHTGKDISRGERGSNAHKCDVDLETMFSGDRIKTVEITKANDQDAGVLTTFQLAPFDLGKDDDGDVFRTYIVTPEIPDQVQTVKDRKLSDKQELAKRALAEVLASGGKPPPAEFQLPRSVICVTDEEAWLAEMQRNGAIDRDAKNPRARFTELRNALAARHVIGARDSFVWLPTKGTL